MRYTLTEIRGFTTKKILELMENAKSKIAIYAAMNPNAARRHSMNLIRFEQVLNEKNIDSANLNINPDTGEEE